MNEHDYKRKQWLIYNSRKTIRIITRKNKRKRKAVLKTRQKYVKATPRNSDLTHKKFRREPEIMKNVNC